MFQVYMKNVKQCLKKVAAQKASLLLIPRRPGRSYSPGARDRRAEALEPRHLQEGKQDPSASPLLTLAELEQGFHPEQPYPLLEPVDEACHSLEPKPHGNRDHHHTLPPT